MNFHNDKSTFRFMIFKIAEKNKVREEILEKDYYVTLLLKELSEKENQSYAYFKGGTALYKALKSIRRFSEDIDLTVYVNDLPNNSQKQKRLKEIVKGFNSLEFKEKLVDRRGSIEVSYSYDSVFDNNMEDILQRYGIVKIEATSFTVSEPITYLEIAPHLYELASDEEKLILESEYNVKPFKIGVNTLERIFLDKVFASENYFINQKFTDFTKHIYDITVMMKLNQIENFLNDLPSLLNILELKKYEESVRIGGLDYNINISEFRYINNSDFYYSMNFRKTLKYIHALYVFNEADYNTIDEIVEALNSLLSIFENYNL